MIFPTPIERTEPDEKRLEYVGLATEGCLWRDELEVDLGIEFVWSRVNVVVAPDDPSAEEGANEGADEGTDEAADAEAAGADPPLLVLFPSLSDVSHELVE